ncbi:hypothetical protein BC628DRAFT_1420720 [Trametes gibbosa]|nr:hypothetical protein BC628DRAFT_1420720 [Trametes gibbosa]
MGSDVFDRLPYDVWYIIFQFVCTDGGKAGCALALTSKACRRASSSTRFFSVSLYSVRHVRNFLICLKRTTLFSGKEAPVHHLFLSFLPETCDAPVRAWRTKWTDYPRNERAMVAQLLHEQRQWNMQKIAWNYTFMTNVSALFARIGNTLRTLVVLQSRDVRLPLVNCPLPALRELTLLGDDRLFVRVPQPGVRLPREGDDSDFNFYGIQPPDPDGPKDAPFPSLRRLHVIFAWAKLHPWEQTLPRWAALAPAVTHLRISQGSAQVVHMVRDMLGLPQPPPSGDRSAGEGGFDGSLGAEPLIVAATPDTIPTYPSLRLVIVQLSRAPQWASSGTAAGVLAQRRDVERVAAECAQESRCRAWVTVLRSRLYEDQYWPRRLPREWRNRMIGGGGCWTEDEYYEDERWGVSAIEPLPKSEGPLTLDLSSDRVPERPKKTKWWQAVFSSGRRNLM